MFCFIFLTYGHAHKRRVKNSHPLYVALGYFHNQADALQYICDVVDSPLLSNSQSPDRLKQQGKKMLFLPQPPCLTHTHTAVIQRQCIRPTLTPQMCSSSVLSAGLLRSQQSWSSASVSLFLFTLVCMYSFLIFTLTMLTKSSCCSCGV